MNFLYSFFLLPGLIFFAHIAAVFSKNLRNPLFERNKVFREIKVFNKRYIKSKKTIVIHTASMGEFEHIKPVIRKLKNEFDVNILVTFFSPSGYEHVKEFPGVDYFLYLPYDFQWLWKKFYLATKCKILLISKHDVWPNQIKMANKLAVKAILLNASLSANSSRKSFMAKIFLAEAYKSLDKIFVISNQDNEQLVSAFGCQNTEVVGDTKFDQVLTRKEEAEKEQLLNPEWISDNKILVFGSLWPQDAEQVLKEITALLERNKSLKIIIVPHQPTDEIIFKFLPYFRDYEHSLFSEKTTLESRILIVNSVGLLADMYKHANFAYVGGSFKQGIHNVIEPAIYGIPVLHGPVYKNSFEAIQLLETGGSQVVNGPSEFNKNIQTFMDDESLRESKGKIAKEYASQNTGSTTKILDYISHILD